MNIRITLLLLLSTSLTAQNITYKKVDEVKQIFIYSYIHVYDSVSNQPKITTVTSLHIGENYTAFGGLVEYIKDEGYYNMQENENLNTKVYEKEFWAKIMKVDGSVLTKYKIIKKGDETILFENMENVKYQYSETVNHKWRLAEEADTTILGYKCYKAYISYSGREYTAWYAPEIPISSGPYKFSGLPGLIVRLHDSRYNHIFELAAIEESSPNQPMIIRQNCKEITGKEYIKAKRAQLQAQIHRYGNPNRVEGSTSDIDRMTARMMMFNNYIERP